MLNAPMTAIAAVSEKVKTASGATAVQIVEKKHGQRTILEHVGSARDETELAALLQAGRDKLHANQPMLDLTAGPRSAAVAAHAVLGPDDAADGHDQDDADDHFKRVHGRLLPIILSLVN